MILSDVTGIMIIQMQFNNIEAQGLKNEINKRRFHLTHSSQQMSFLYQEAANGIFLFEACLFLNRVLRFSVREIRNWFLKQNPVFSYWNKDHFILFSPFFWSWSFFHCRRWNMYWPKKKNLRPRHVSCFYKMFLLVQGYCFFKQDLWAFPQKADKPVRCFRR